MLLGGQRAGRLRSRMQGCVALLALLCRRGCHACVQSGVSSRVGSYWHVQKQIFFVCAEREFSCITPPMKAVWIVIPVALLYITSSEGIVVVQILIQGKIQCIDMLQRNCVNKIAFLLIIGEKNCRVIQYSSL